MNPRRTPQPVRCFTEPVRMSRPLEDHHSTRTCIRATANTPDAPGAAVFDATATVAGIAVHSPAGPQDGHLRPCPAHPTTLLLQQQMLPEANQSAPYRDRLLRR